MTDAGNGRSGLPPQAFAGYDRKRLRRFYAQAGVETVDGLWRITLDGKTVRTPARAALAVANPGLAEAIAAEWQQQDVDIVPETMPLTRLANSAIDGVTGRESEVVEDILRYAGSDLLLYRAEEPAGLRDMQAKYWDATVEWARNTLNAPLIITTGIMPVPQPPAAVEAIRPYVNGYSALPLAALHSMTTLTGSTLLTLAHAHGRLSAEDVWTAAHADEDWQAATWGQDAEAQRRREARRAEMLAASRFFHLSKACGT